MNKNHAANKGISDIAGCITDPIIVFPGGWGDTLPDWLKNTITLERMMWNMKTLKGEEATGTDAEACAYLYTASLTAPMDSDWTQIYMYVAGKTNKQWNDIEVPDDIAVNTINDYQRGMLKGLKDWIYQQRIKARADRDRAERSQNKEAKEIQNKREQPALFEF